MHTREEIICDPALTRSYEGLLKPVASAGGLHSIELYLCLKQCIGVGPGFYHYDSFDHSLGRMSDLNKSCQKMLEMAVNTTCRAPQAASISPGQAATGFSLSDTTTSNVHASVYVFVSASAHVSVHMFYMYR